MKNKNMLTSFALTLIALSVIGFTYAGWRDRVFIEGTAHMGELIVGILVKPLPDDWDEPVKIVETTNGYPENGTGAPSTGPGSFIPKPWVANTTVFLNDFRTSVHHDPVETVAHYMRFYINNSYPQYDAHIRFFIKNAGTIPAHVRFILFNVTVEGVTDPLRYLEIANETWTYDPVNEYWDGEGYVYDPVEDTYPIRWHIRFYARAISSRQESGLEGDPGKVTVGMNLTRVHWFYQFSLFLSYGLPPVCWDSYPRSLPAVACSPI